MLSESLTADTIFYRDISTSVDAPFRWIVALHSTSARRYPPICWACRLVLPSACAPGWLRSSPRSRAFPAPGYWHSVQRLISPLSDWVYRLQSRQLLCNLMSFNYIQMKEPPATWRYLHNSSRSMLFVPPPKSPLKKLSFGGSGISHWR